MHDEIRGVLGSEVQDDKITVLNRGLVWRDRLITFDEDTRIVGTVGLEEFGRTNRGGRRSQGVEQRPGEQVQECRFTWRWTCVTCRWP